MFPFLIALIAFVVAGIAASRLMQRLPAAASDDLKPGLAHLAELRWRDFAKLVLQTMKGRGLDVVRSEGGPADGLPSDGGDIVLEHEGNRTLLSCRYGHAAKLTVQAFDSLTKSARLRGAQDIIVAIPGVADEETRRIAKLQRVELLDGPALWPQVRAFVDPTVLPQDTDKRPERMRAAIPWLGAAVVGGLAWMLAQGLVESAPDDAPSASAAPSAAQIAAPQAAAAPAREEPIPSDPTTLERRRKETADAISTLAGVDRAVWSTQSTLLVYLTSDDADPSTSLCPLLERYPELAASRVQMQPPAGSDRPVRFRQCRAY